MQAIIGLFDILGYRGILKYNDAHAVDHVLGLIAGLEKELPQVTTLLITKGDLKSEELVKEIHWLAFSDTILTWIELKPTDSPETTRSKWCLFTIVNAFLQRRMFEYGLPLRGAIDHGEFFQKQYCFGGKAILSCYELGNSFDAAVCTATPESALLFQQSVSGTSLEMIGKIFVNYEVPTKEGSIILPTLDWLRIRHERSPKIGDNLEEIVLQVFEAHNKPVDERARVKANNTVALMRFWRSIAKGTF